MAVPVTDGKQRFGLGIPSGKRILPHMAERRPSKNKLTIAQLKIACRHVRELIDARVTENLAIRSLEQFTDFYAKLCLGGSVTPHHVRQVDKRQWSIAARMQHAQDPKALLRVEHGTPRRAFARKVLDLFDKGNLTEIEMETLIRKFWKLAVITTEEDARLNRIARSKAAELAGGEMETGWNFLRSVGRGGRHVG